MLRNLFSLRPIGLALLLSVTGVTFHDLGAGGRALATSIGDLPTAEPGALDIRGPVLPGPRETNVTEALPADAFNAYREMLKLRNATAKRSGLPEYTTEQLHLGVEDLIGLMAAGNPLGTGVLEAGLSVDQSQSLDWMRFWTDFAFVPEAEQLFDAQSIALARYSPEIRYWLENARWASFDSQLPGFNDPIGSRPTPGGESANGARHDGMMSHPSFRADGGSGGTDRKPQSQPTKKVSLSLFLLSLGEKLIRQPIFYIIVLITLVVLFVSMRAQPRTSDS